MGFSVRGLELFARSRTRPEIVTESPGLRIAEARSSHRSGKTRRLTWRGGGQGGCLDLLMDTAGKYSIVAPSSMFLRSLASVVSNDCSLVSSLVLSLSTHLH